MKASTTVLPKKNSSFSLVLLHLMLKMPSQAYNYNINKYSVYKSDTNSWYHYPQRTNLSVTFVYNGDQADQIDVIVHWKGSNLVRILFLVYSFQLFICVCLLY